MNSAPKLSSQNLRSFRFLLLFFLVDAGKSVSIQTNLTPNQQALANLKFPRTWIPLASAYELDPDRPSPVKFLGQSYVTYRDNQGNWVVFDDACPHRLAPLSEGRIDRFADALECAYHGWSFDSSGQCRRIPQIRETTFDAVRSNPRCNLHSYSVIVHKQLIFAWLWPEDPLSVIGNPQAHPEGMMEDLADVYRTATRDLPYGWDVLIENIADPSHVPFAHHNLQGTRDDAIPINMTLPVVSEWGFECYFGDRTVKKMRQGKLTFRAPFGVWYDAVFDDPSRTKFQLSAILTPTKPGYSRIILLTTKRQEQEPSNEEKENSNDKNIVKKKKNKKPLIAVLFRYLPEWIIHQFTNRFLDSDLAFLHYQDRERARRGGKMEDFYLIPAPSDRSIRAVHDWITKYAHFPVPLPESPSRDVLYDRKSQHTDHCKFCSEALNKKIPRWRKKTYVLMSIGILLSKMLVGRLAIVGCLAILHWLSKMESALTKGGYEHHSQP